MSRWRAIAFDLDDTLYPERDFVLSGLRAVAAWAELNLSIPAVRGFAELTQLYQQSGHGDTFDHWLMMYNLESADLVQQLVDVYRHHKPALAPFPEVPALLARLRRRYQLALLSDGYLAVQRRKLDALNLAHCFDVIVFSDEWGQESWKPSTKPFEILLERLGIDADAAVYVADNPIKDFWGARQVGMSTVWVRRPEAEYGHLRPPTDEHAADICIESLTMLREALIQLQAG